MKKTKKQAFTLIELLVVIAIIGILATLAVVSLQTARAKARDAKRIADVKQIQTALELYYNDFNTYPVGPLVGAGGNMAPYMATIPVPPVTADCTPNTYDYKQRTSGSSYTIAFCVKTKTGGLTVDGAQCASTVGIISAACPI